MRTNMPVIWLGAGATPAAVGRGTGAGT